MLNRFVAAWQRRRRPFLLLAALALASLPAGIHCANAALAQERPLPTHVRPLLAGIVCLDVQTTLRLRSVGVLDAPQSPRPEYGRVSLR